MNDLTHTQNHRLSMTDDQIDLIKKQIMPPNSTNDDLRLFLNVVERTGLDPFARQIYAIRRMGKISHEVSIDGARLTAERSSVYAGQLGPWWCGEDGEWKDVWISSRPPVAAKISVMRKDFKEPLTAIALYSEYLPSDPKQQFIWKKFPSLMIAKVAEMLALRRAFPRELSGIYSQDEMSQVVEVEAKKTEPNSLTVTINESQKKIEDIKLLIKKLTNDFTDKPKLDELRAKHEIPASTELPKLELEKLDLILDKLREEVEIAMQQN